MPPRKLDRRRFLQLTGLGAGAALALPGTNGVGRVIFGGRRLHVGVMVPTGSRYEPMADHLLEGLRLGFLGSGVAGAGLAATPARIVTQTVFRGYGGAREAAQRLLHDQKVDVVVGWVTAPVARRIADLFEERQVPLMVVNIGAHVASPPARSPYLLYNSLNYWQSSFAMGSWAAERVGRRAVITTSLADSGYDTVYAFRRAFEAAGGTVAGTVVTHTEPRKRGLATLFRTVRRTDPDFVYALHTGDAAVDLVRGYSARGMGGRAPLLGGGLLTEDYVLPRLGPVANGIRTSFSWAGNLDTPANARFRESYRERTGRSADVFAVLGYDTALLLAAGARRAQEMGGLRRLANALAGARVEGPRGVLSLDPATNVVQSPLYIREVGASGGSLTNLVLATVPAVPAFPSELRPLDTQLASGYLNECLCP